MLRLFCFVMEGPVLRKIPTLLFFLFGVLSCSKGGLTPISEVQTVVVDNLLDLKGTVCTDPPEQTAFPVKILFIIDTSGSMQFVDNDYRRARAVEEVVMQLRNNAGVSFGIISFNGKDQVLTTETTSAVNAANPLGTDLSGAFTQDAAVLQRAVNQLREAELVTDYQGALSTAFRVLSQDMLKTPKAELARTRYVLLFLSDGDPFPTCCSEDSQAAGLCTRDTNIYFCEDPDWARGQVTNGALVLPFLSAQQDYNQNYQINAGVRDIMELTQSFTVGDLRMHTAFIFDQSKVGQLDANGCYVIGGVNFVCPEKARTLLSGMADIGGGVFRDFSSAEELDFLSFDLTNIKRDNAMKNLIVMNDNYRLYDDKLAVDSDGDGLSDTLEYEQGFNPLSTDTDSDGFSDSVEWSLRTVGFDVAKENKGCGEAADRVDVDADGLVRCEELLLNTSTELFDTDADGVPDMVEVRAGTNPAVSDALSDADLDGVRNGDEIRVHTDIGFDEDTSRPTLAYRYRMTEVDAADDGGRCYDFRVKNVQLGTPQARAGEDNSYGRNDLMIYLAQAPFDDPSDYGSYKVACVRGRYIAPDFKDPLTGEVKLTPEDFHNPDELDKTQHCVGLMGAQ